MLEHEKIFIDAALKRTKTNNGKKPELIEPASLCFERLSSSGVTALVSDGPKGGLTLFFLCVCVWR